jgi:hypothetical protein
LFDPTGTTAARKICSDAVHLSKWTALLNKSLSGYQSMVRSRSEAYVLDALEGIYPGHVATGVPLSEIFSSSLQAAIALIPEANRTVSSGQIASAAFKAQRDLLPGKEADILVLTPLGQVKFCVEVDGPHHRQHSQIKCDLTKSSIFLAHRIPVYRVTSLESRMAHVATTAGNAGAFIALFQLAHQRWLQFEANPNITTMQLHKP